MTTWTRTSPAGLDTVTYQGSNGWIITSTTVVRHRRNGGGRTTRRFTVTDAQGAQVGGRFTSLAEAKTSAA